MDNLILRYKKNRQIAALRAEFINQLYPTKPIGTADEQQTLILSEFFGSAKRYFGNQSTAYDNGSVQRGATSTVHQFERQIERVFIEVLGQAPGRNPTVLRNLYKSKLTRTNEGALATPPSRSTPYDYGSTGTELLGELSTRQAALYRQTSIVVADALKILERLSSFVTQSDQERVEALRSLITSNIKALVEEFRWVDEPRPARVDYYLSSITDNVIEFGRQAYLNNPRLAVTIDDENQVTQFELLRTYVQTLKQAWENYLALAQSDQASPLSERIDRARVLLAVLTQAVIDLISSLDSVGLSDSERRSRASRFSTLARPNLELPRDPNINTATAPSRILTNLGDALPNITVSDLIDWLDRFVNQEALSILDNTYGIDFVTDQSDQLFWTIAPIVAHLKTTAPINAASRSMLEQILSNERVTWALDNLLIQLHELANLSV